MEGGSFSECLRDVMAKSLFGLSLHQSTWRPRCLQQSRPLVRTNRCNWYPAVKFCAMTYATTQSNSGGWVKEAKSNRRVIIEGAKARKGRPSSKGTISELRTMTTRQPGVALVDMEMYNEISEKRRVRE